MRPAPVHQDFLPCSPARSSANHLRIKTAVGIITVIALVIAGFLLFRSGIIFGSSRKAAMWNSLGTLNTQPIEFYGKLEDQDGSPVPGVKVTADVMVAKQWMSGKGVYFYTTTDQHGLFSFRDLEGRDISFLFEKPGYEYRDDPGKPSLFSYSLLTKPAERFHPNPNQPVAFTIWKLRGPEPLIHFHLGRVRTPVNSGALSFDFMSRTKVESGGDLVVTFTRNPEHIDRGKRFDWKAIISVPNGGLIPFDRIYAYEAPEEGYQPEFIIDMPADSPDWTSSVTHNFYVKSRGGKLYARITLTITADYEPPPTGTTLDAYVNPNGSRNLEYDPYKRITPH